MPQFPSTTLHSSLPALPVGGVSSENASEEAACQRIPRNGKSPHSLFAAPGAVAAIRFRRVISACAAREADSFLPERSRSRDGRGMRHGDLTGSSFDKLTEGEKSATSDS